MPESARNGPRNGLFLTPRQEAAAVLLARGSTAAGAAAGCGAGERTVKTWVSLPHFRRRVSELRGQITEQALGELVDNMSSASQTLGFLSRKAKSEMCRLAASRAILELGAKLRENVELEQRLAAVEEARGGQPQRAPRPA
jgi:hypothetical protein